MWCWPIRKVAIKEACFPVPVTLAHCVAVFLKSAWNKMSALTCRKLPSVLHLISLRDSVFFVVCFVISVVHLPCILLVLKERAIFICNHYLNM